MTENTSPEPEGENISEADLDALLASLFGEPADPFDGVEPESQSTTLIVGDKIPVRITIEYPEGHAYEAAQAQAGLGFDLNVAAFALSFADDSVKEHAAAAGLEAGDAHDAFERLADRDNALPDGVSPAGANFYDPLAVLVAERDAALAQK